MSCTAIINLQAPNQVQSEAAVVQQQHETIALLYTSLKNLKPPWIVQTPCPNIQLCIVSDQSSSSKQPLKVTHSLTVHEDMTWEVFVFGHKVNCIHTPLSIIPQHLNADSLLRLLKLVEKSTVCPGNPDMRFVELVSSRKGKRIMSGSGTLKAYVDDGFDVVMDGKVFCSTVRTAACTILSCGSKCNSCCQYRSHLRSMHSRWSRKRSIPAKNGNNRYLTTPQKANKLKSLQVRAQTAEKEVKRLKEAITESTARDGVQVPPDLHDDLSSIMESNNDTVLQDFPPGSFRRLFWDEQLKANRVKDTRQMRWHPMMIRWCLNLKLLSSSSYHALRTSGFIKLPSERTLRDYTHFFNTKPGFQVEVGEMLVRDVKLSELPDWKKHVVLLLDEMKIKESLVYDKHGAEVIGFVNLGTINDQLAQFERDLAKTNRTAETNQPPPIANHILAIMVRGIFIRLRFAYAHFPTTGIHSDYLFSIVWEAVEHLESLGFKVLVITADGASPNRKFFHMHGNKCNEVCHKTENPYTDENRCIYFMSDVPHLMKTTRNCWSHSFAHGYKRKLCVRLTCMLKRE